MKVPIDPHSDQHFERVSSRFVRCIVVCHCHFNLHFFDANDA